MASGPATPSVHRHPRPGAEDGRSRIGRRAPLPDFFHLPSHSRGVNITLEPHRPYVGASAFTHKAGLHTSALARRPDAYEHTRPDLVGNHTRMVISEQAGRAAVIRRAASLGLSVSQDLAGRCSVASRRRNTADTSSKRPTGPSSCW